MFVDPTVALDLKGNAFLIDGNDHNPDGTAGTDAAVAGIATAIGSPPGSNTVTILSQIPSKSYDQVLGSGGMPSVSEAGGVDINALFSQFKAMKTHDISPGTYTDPSMGSLSAMEINYVSGDLHLAGKGKGGWCASRRRLGNAHGSVRLPTGSSLSRATCASPVVGLVFTSTARCSWGSR